ncbi:hypothetical protein [Lysinibacillus fusiformis]|uniref:hypothetical protein n=1 Tax=Lysinibacillus fusiformis TaxID=28031 RepID=UPI001ABFEC5C|nr:hypothetical protein [Lysinibacillus fusiformis]
MINQVVVRIAAERILNKGLNPKTEKKYVIDDITNEDYRVAVEDYILTNIKDV